MVRKERENHQLQRVHDGRRNPHPGWSYLGIIGHGGRNTGSEVLYYAEAKFGYGIGVNITYSDACTQVDRFNDSSYGYKKSCNVG